LPCKKIIGAQLAIQAGGDLRGRDGMHDGRPPKMICAERLGRHEEARILQRAPLMGVARPAAYNIGYQHDLGRVDPRAV
jgi:hypothetical protein